MEGQNDKISKIMEMYTCKLENYEDKVVECRVLKEQSESISFQLETSLLRNQELLTAYGRLQSQLEQENTTNRSQNQAEGRQMQMEMNRKEMTINKDDQSAALQHPFLPQPQQQQHQDELTRLRRQNTQLRQIYTNRYEEASQLLRQKQQQIQSFMYSRSILEVKVS